KSGDLLRRLSRVLKEGKRAAIGRERGHADVGRDHPQIVFLDLHVAHDFRTKRAGAMRQSRAAEAGVKLVSDGGAADLRCALEDERLESSFGQIEGGDEAVVASADDDDIAGAVRLRRHSYAAPLMSLRISSAASRPFAPMMPPPGCVADPHMERFLIGVRYCAQPGTGRRKK